MTRLDSKIDQAFPADRPIPMSVFESWVEPARQKAQLWRTLVGGILVIAIWAFWTFAMMIIAIVSGAMTPEAMQSLLGQGDIRLGADQTVMLTCVLLATFIGLWLGVFFAARVLNVRKFATVLSWNGRVNFGELAVGFLIGAAYLGIGLITSIASGHPPVRSTVDMSAWLAGLAPILVFLFLQTAGEEIFFRGYLVQQFAARFRSPLVWALVPAILFGLGHYANVADPVYAAYYVAATVMFALIATVIVWRTGSIAAAIGLHFANNIGAFLIAGPEGPGSGMQLWLSPESDVLAGAPLDLITLLLLFSFVLSSWAPFPKGQPRRRRNETRAAP